MEAKTAYRPVTVRFDPLLLAKLKEIAAAERRSLNSQILFLLQRRVALAQRQHRA